MKVTTKTGDKGKTLYKTQNISKGDERIEFLGSIDELQVALGNISDVNEEIKMNIQTIQKKIFNIYSNQVETEDIEEIENWQEELMKSKHITYDWNLTTQKTFPIDFARVTARKVERNYSRLENLEEINENVQAYLNRLSDFLWVLGRFVESVPKDNDKKNLIT